MLRRSLFDLHRTGKRRAYVLRDQNLTHMSTGNSHRTMLRTGIGVTSRGQGGAKKSGDINGTEQYKHAFPLLTHTDFGYNDQSAKTDWVELGNYMPKRNKGTPPWWRGADTYSPLYCEQGRYEYQRYLMISRFPSEFKKYFQTFLSNIRRAARPVSYVLPQEALHWLLRMIVDNFNPQHIHYLTAMQILASKGEYDMARDAWKIMEREQTFPDDKCIAMYLEVCARAKEKEWAFQCWNRYCTEKAFLADGEADPKPVSRTPFTLNRDELLYLPKWKKHFDHDPNLDVADLNRFNTTRNIYRWMSIAMLNAGEAPLYTQLFERLEKALMTTPTPVPEPPNPHTAATPKWAPTKDQAHIQTDPWQYGDVSARQALGPEETVVEELEARFLTNDAFYLRYCADIASFVADGAPVPTGETPAAFLDALVDRAFTTLGPKMADLDASTFFASVLRAKRIVGGVTGTEVRAAATALYRRKAKSSGEADAVMETPHEAVYLEVLRGFSAESSVGRNFDPRKVVAEMTVVVKEMTSMSSFTWAADQHLEIVRVLVNCGTMAGNEYFVKNVLRKFKWNSEFCSVLYGEYRLHDDSEMWAELTKRMLVWTERYRVTLSEESKRLIEEDYDIIKVQVRSFKDLAAFAYRDVEEKAQARDPASQLPNPVMDYVSHALPFPDRDTGYPNEYGDIGQWRRPESAVRGPNYYAPGMEGAEEHRGYTAEWRENSAVVNPVKMPGPWDRKYAEYNRGKHPSYDMQYAGPMPEIFPARMNFRKQTRWDFQNVEQQSKFKMAGPY